MCVCVHVYVYVCVCVCVREIGWNLELHMDVYGLY